MDIIPKNKQKATAWSGGLTTELYIFPKDSSYTEQNFKYRISTATVEIETSTFTALPGVERTLMVLEGSINLDHKNHHTVTLTSLEKDEFKGDWTTASKGTCLDLNLMRREGTKGDLTGLNMQKNESIKYKLNGISNFLFLNTGQIEIENTIIDKGAFIVFDKTQEEATILALEPSEIVLIMIMDI